MEVIGYDNVGNVRAVIDGTEWAIPPEPSHPLWQRVMEWVAQGGSIPAYAAPPETVPNLEPDQFWFVVRASGYEPELLAWVEAMKQSDPVNWAAASSKLQFAKFFERDHPFIEEARLAIGMSEAELDALWAFGAN